MDILYTKGPAAWQTLAERPAAGNAAELARLHSISDQIGEAVFLSETSSGQLLDVNETACRWLGLERKGLLARSIRDLRDEPPLRVPPHRDDPLTETRGAARPLIVEGVCRRRDGSVFAVESSITTVTVGNRLCTLAIVRDAKRKAHAQEQLRDLRDRHRRLLEDVRDAVFVTTRVGEIVEANSSALSLFACDRDEIIGVDLRRRLVFRPDEIRRFQEDTRRNGRVADLPVQLRRGEGAAVRAFLTATPLFSPDGAVRGYQCILRAALPQAAVPQPESPAAGKMVLLVAADTDTAKNAEEPLQRAGISTVTVNDAQAAARAIRARPRQVGALVLDVDLLRAVLAISEDIPILAIGDELTLSTAERLTLAQRIEFLPGPAHPLALVQRVQALLDPPAPPS